MGALQTGVDLANYYYSTRSDSNGYSVSTDTLIAQAARKELEADEALARGDLLQGESVLAGRRERAGLVSDYAASGVRVDSGSAVEVVADRAAWSEYDRQKIAYEAEYESWGLRYDAALLRQEAGNAQATAEHSDRVNRWSAHIGMAQTLGLVN
ncbi:MAG: hypothetical protein LIQ30_11725 [Planctomycetes bacterium]|nr:hypothetical protein [Planctomycetota bacterium]MCC8115693.1 hypothetical protein [Planctomycetota bacterium]MCD7896502.1 hypothetical protein [Planctomycetaceae bacterium]